MRLADSYTLTGQKIGRYDIRYPIGKGGMAEVYLAHDIELKRDVCLKLMSASFLGDKDLIARFHREAEATARLSHPHIIPIYDYGLAPTGQPFFAMEYVPGGTLHDLLKQAHEQGAWLPAPHVLEWARQVADALTAVHAANMVHRDLKPSNILLRANGTAVLADLGIVSVQTATRLTLEGKQPGTPAYMSPEQARGQRLDNRSDIYSLGIILYELLAAKRPFDAPSSVEILHQQIHQPPPPLSKARPGLSRATYQLVNTCLQKDPAQRYQTTDHLLAAIEQAIAAEQNGGMVGTMSRRWVYVVAPLGLVLLALLLWQVWPQSSQPTPEVASVALATRIPTATLTAVLPTTTQPAREIAVVVAETAVSTATNPPPTETAVPTFTLAPTATPFPTFTAMPTQETAVSCPSPGSRWGSTLYADHDERLGCPLNQATSPNAAYQVFPNGLMVWRADTDAVYVLFSDNNTFAIYDSSGFPRQYDGMNDVHKGAFGWLWLNVGNIRSRLGETGQTEANPTNFAIQDFEYGVIFYFAENNARNYVLFTDSYQWVAQ